MGGANKARGRRKEIEKHREMIIMQGLLSWCDLAVDILPLWKLDMTVNLSPLSFRNQNCKSVKYNHGPADLRKSLRAWTNRGRSSQRWAIILGERKLKNPQNRCHFRGNRLQALQLMWGLQRGSDSRRLNPLNEVSALCRRGQNKLEICDVACLICTCSTSLKEQGRRWREGRGNRYLF